MEMKVIGMEQAQEMMELIKDAFSVEPWKDRWTDETVLYQYLQDIVGNENSLTLGLYEDGALVGLASGRLKHWYDGVEFCIDDFCIKTSHQGNGAGTQFLQLIRRYAQTHHYKSISLRTDRTAAAYRFYQKNGFQESRNQVYFSLDLREP